MSKSKKLDPASRLIIAADFSGFEGRLEARKKVLTLADQLSGTGVIIKINSILRACGYDFIDELHARELKVFADLKLNDIPSTMKTDGELLFETSPYILTAMCSAGVEGLRALKKQLPNTEVLGVTVLTSMNEGASEVIYGTSVTKATKNFAFYASEAKIGGLISSPAELADLTKLYGNVLTFNTPGIRPAWSQVKGDDQNPERTMTPADAIKAGADRIVIGRPITQADSPLDAVNRTLDEIREALA